MAMATGAVVVAKSVASKAAVNAAATLGKGLAKKGAAEVGKGLGALADGSRDFLAASMAFQQVGQAFKVTGPAMSLVAAEFTSATMETRLQLMTSLINLVQSPGFEAFMNNFTDFVNWLIGMAAEFTDVITKIGNDLVPLRTQINQIFSDIATKLNELLGITQVSNPPGTTDTNPGQTAPDKSWWDNLWASIFGGFQAGTFGQGRF